jgi:hypothetical protein
LLAIINFQAKITIMVIKLFILLTLQSVPAGFYYLVRDVGVALKTLLVDSETKTEKCHDLFYLRPLFFLHPGSSLE